MKKYQSGFVIPLLVLIIIFLLGSVIFLSFNKKEEKGVTDSEDIKSEQVTEECRALVVTSIEPSSFYEMPGDNGSMYTLNVSIDNTRATEKCHWTSSEGIVGKAQLYAYNIDGKSTGWQPIGYPVTLGSEKWNYKTFSFLMRIGNSEMGISPEVTPMKVVFTDANEKDGSLQMKVEFPIPTDVAKIAQCDPLKIASLQPNARVSFPLTVSGMVDNSKKGCTWTMFEGQAGTWQLLAQNKVGWESINKGPIPVEDWMTTKTNFSFVVSDMGLNAPAGTKMKLVFSAENPSGMESKAKSFELPLIK